MELMDAAEAWEPLAQSDWNQSAAAHLLRRTGWSARPEEVQRAQVEGLDRTLERLFPAVPIDLPKPAVLERFAADWPDLQQKVRHATGQEKRAAQRDLRERSQAALQDLRIAWLQMAATPENAAFAKWVLFLSDVYVVSADKVRNAQYIWKHFDTLGTHALGPAPALTKAVSRSPAMAMYLDLTRSGKEMPNENFARELFELFVLGEGHYSEPDIKEAARAFTGYRVDPATGEFRFARRQHDDGSKTVFGKTARFSGDDVIDLAYQQPAAPTFLPRELVRFYLTDDALPSAHAAVLGAEWRDSDFDLRTLVRKFFGSRVFFSPQFRGNLIKSPVQLYLGLLHDLELSVTPLPRYSTARLRQMGQELFQPPNVRGWVGGRAWINSSTLAVRRQFIQQLFSPLREETLNADEQRVLQEARAQGMDNFTVSERWLERNGDGSPDELSLRLTRAFLAEGGTETVIGALRGFLADGPRDRPGERLRTAMTALLQTPVYQLC